MTYPTRATEITHKLIDMIVSRVINGESLESISGHARYPKYELLLRWLDHGRQPPEEGESRFAGKWRRLYNEYIGALKMRTIVEYDRIVEIEKKIESGELAATAGMAVLKSIQWRIERLNQELFDNSKKKGDGVAEVTHIHKIGAERIGHASAMPITYNKSYKPGDDDEWTKPPVHTGTA